MAGAILVGGLAYLLWHEFESIRIDSVFKVN